MSSQPTATSLAVVDAYYKAGRKGQLTDFAPYLHDDFTVTAPDYFPWGGRHEGASFFRDEVLPTLPDVLDFSRCSYDRFFGDGENVVALIAIGVSGTGEQVRISEHWTVRGEQATSIWVAYFEPQPLLRKLGLTVPGIPA
ncbi:nuclear transport factor 2 family protein [Amycolatopsis sp. NBC_01488]|uniref:nuclear transport factor 2 family protein n=1 Tax=Amycolatopsis sp. NBC_01488 TaxID=2903563 RepID=UPI002E2D1B75|nr:nuclear transport factor 2 family protein [Amycolatopsis sp. NBC_01488]